MRAIALASVILVTLGGCLAGRPRPPCSDRGSIHTLCGFENPEDLEYVEAADVVLVSNTRSESDPPGGGFLAAFVPGTRDVFRVWPPRGGSAAEPDSTLGDAACKEPPSPDAFRPHGITSRTRAERTLVFVTGHAGSNGGREAVEIFTLLGSGGDARLTWNACIPTPLSVQANDIAVNADGAVVVSNYRPNASLVYALKASLLGTATGDVMAWRPESGWSHLAETASSMAKGVALSSDGKMLFYTESMTGSIHRLPLDGGGGAISVEVDGHPDNLSWTKRGTLLVASHTAGYGFVACLFGRRPCTSSWAVFEINPNTLSVTKVLAHDGSLLGAVSSVLQVGRSLLLGSVFDDRIGIVDVERGGEVSRTAALRRFRRSSIRCSDGRRVGAEVARCCGRVGVGIRTRPQAGAFRQSHP